MSDGRDRGPDGGDLSETKGFFTFPEQGLGERTSYRLEVARSDRGGPCTGRNVSLAVNGRTATPAVLHFDTSGNIFDPGGENLFGNVAGWRFSGQLHCVSVEQLAEDRKERLATLEEGKRVWDTEKTFADEIRPTLTPTQACLNALLLLTHESEPDRAAILRVAELHDQLRRQVAKVAVTRATVWSSPDGACSSPTSFLVGSAPGAGEYSMAAVVRFPAGYQPDKREWLLDFGQRGTGGEHWLFSMGGNSRVNIQFGNWNDGGRGGQIHLRMPVVDSSRDTVICTTHTPGVGGYKLYWDGELVAMGSGNCNITTGNLYVKTKMWSEGNFSGEVKDVKVWLGTVLEPDQVPGSAAGGGAGGEEKKEDAPPRAGAKEEVLVQTHAEEEKQDPRFAATPAFTARKNILALADTAVATVHEEIESSARGAAAIKTAMGKWTDPGDWKENAAKVVDRERHAAEDRRVAPPPPALKSAGAKVARAREMCNYLVYHAGVVDMIKIDPEPAPSPETATFREAKFACLCVDLATEIGKSELTKDNSPEVVAALESLRKVHNVKVVKAARAAEEECRLESRRRREKLAALRKALDAAATAGVKEAVPENEGVRIGRATEGRVQTWLDREEALNRAVAANSVVEIIGAVQEIQKGRAETGALPFAKHLLPVLAKLTKDAPRNIAEVVKMADKHGIRRATEWSFGVYTVAHTICDDDPGQAAGGAEEQKDGGGGAEEQKDGGRGGGGGAPDKGLDEEIRKAVEDALTFADSLRPHETVVAELYPVICSADDVISESLDDMKASKADLIKSLGPPWLAQHAGALITWLFDPNKGDCKSLSVLQESIEDGDIDKGHVKSVIEEAGQPVNVKAENVYFKAFEQAVKDTQEQDREKVAERARSKIKFAFAKMRLGKPIGKGQYGKVFEAELQVKIGAAPEVKKIAAKTVDKKLASPTVIDDQIAETERNAKISHPNVVACYGWTESDDGKQYFMLSELMEGSVLSLLKTWRAAGTPVTTGTQLTLMMGPALAFAKLHKDGTIHRDIAARNTCFKTIKIDDDTSEDFITKDGRLEVKIMDLGLARDVDDSGKYALTINDDGSFRLAIPIDRTAPECLTFTEDKDAKREVVATLENDVFALTIYFWEVLTCGLTPYEQHKDGRYEQALVLDVPKHVKAGGRLSVPDTGLLVGLKDLMDRMWHKDYTQRPTMQQVVEHLWSMVPWSADKDKVKGWLRGLGVPEGHEALDEGWDGDDILEMCKTEKDMTDYLDQAFKKPEDAELKARIRAALEAQWEAFKDAAHLDKELIEETINHGGPAGDDAGEAEAKGE